MKTPARTVLAALLDALLAGTVGLALSTAAAQAQTASLVRDTNQSGLGTNSSSPALLLTAAGKLFFTADAPGSGRELWATDGTPTGTVLTADLCPGPCSPDLAPLAALPGGLLFSVQEGVSYLWRSDGTWPGPSPWRRRASPSRSRGSSAC
jgi:ELWxxDGT repeat protein